METNEWVTGNIEMMLEGHTVKMQMTVPAKPVKPQRMLPVFQKMTDAFVDISVREIEEKGEKVSCKAGCGACCRQPVPISPIEVYQIAELVESMPEPRRSEIRKRFADACEHFEKLNWFEKVKACDELETTETFETVAIELQKTVSEYFREGIPCPFLENESCSIHESRPLVCREYLVTSPAADCAYPRANPVNRIGMTFRPSIAVQHLERRGEFSKLGILPLIRALELAEKYPEDFEEKSGKTWAAEFLERFTGCKIPAERTNEQTGEQNAARPPEAKT